MTKNDQNVGSKTDTLPKKRRMKPGGGKAKGNGFESTIAKKLSSNLPINFIRSPGSGARIGGKNFETVGKMMGEDVMKLFNADVVPINEKELNLSFLHSIECKFYQNQDSFTGLASGSANVLKWFEEAVVDAKKIGKIPLLIFKWNRTDTFVAVDLTANSEKLPVDLPSPKFSILTYNSDKSVARALDIFILDELLLVPDFWYTQV